MMMPRAHKRCKQGGRGPVAYQAQYVQRWEVEVPTRVFGRASLHILNTNPRVFGSASVGEEKLGAMHCRELARGPWPVGPNTA